MVGAVVVDPDGVYNPGIINDRLLLGLKGTLSDVRAKPATSTFRRGHSSKGASWWVAVLPTSWILWVIEGKSRSIPINEYARLSVWCFRRMAELGSVRQVLLWFRRERIEIPMRIHQPGGRPVWTLPIYTTMRKIPTNPIYAGAYAFGKTNARTTVVDGRARKTAGHKKPRSEWTVLIQEHHSGHSGYISWEQYERHQSMIAANPHMKSRMQPRAGRAEKHCWLDCYDAAGAGGCCTCPITAGEELCCDTSARRHRSTTEKLVHIIRGSADRRGGCE
jgi:hypothetical protein